MSVPAGTAAQVDQAVDLARREGLDLAADWISEARQKRWPGPEPWDLGACIWCEVDHGTRRKATIIDQGGGPPMCGECFDRLTADPEPAALVKDGDR